MTADESDLVKRAQAGDRDALAALLAAYGPRVRGELDINPQWRSVLEEDDVMQVTYFEAFQQIGRFRSDEASFLPWLRRIAQNNLRDAIEWLGRDKRPQPAKQLDAPDGYDAALWLYDLISGGGTTPSGKLAASEVRTVLEKEIEGLPADYARVLTLVYFENKPVGDVAAAMSRTKGAVHLLRLRALHYLRERLGSGTLFFTR